MVSGPIPPFSNPAIQPQFYIPSQFVISAISLGINTTVTTTINHNYVLGQQVRILIPSKYGSRGLNEQTGFVIAIPAANQVTLDTNSQGVNPFIASPTFIQFESKTLPQIIAIGDNESGAINALGRSNTATFVPGSFINISP